jgi:hypothetical protein
MTRRWQNTPEEWLTEHGNQVAAAMIRNRGLN